MGLFKLFKKRDTVPVVRMVDPWMTTIAEWRAQNHLVSMARKVLNNPDLRYMIAVLRASHIAGYELSPGMPVEERAFQQCRCEGYSRAINDLLSLGLPQRSKDDLVATFEEAEDLPQEPENTSTPE